MRSFYSSKDFPVIRGVEWFNLFILALTPLLAVYGFACVSVQRKTMIWTTIYYLISMIGITAGYHRLWSHRSYKASPPLRLFLILAGGSAVQGSCYWWARRHRSHHRYTDTDKDPYNANRGFLWTHIGWMIFRTDLRPGQVDLSDLRNDALVQWQHRWYLAILVVFGFVLPTVIPGMFWGDWWGGVCYVAGLRMSIGHHSVFCVNSLAHYLGHASYDDKHSPRDHFLSALLTLGEGYHNFHHQFPMDYRNAYMWYQYDPTKWFIALCGRLGLATSLRRFPSNEIKKGKLTMKLKKLKGVHDSLQWPLPSHDLPVVTWETFQAESSDRALVLISGFIHDVDAFIEEHPGGAALLKENCGKDMTPAFFGGVYDHSNAAHNLLSMMRVGILAGGVENVGDHDHAMRLPSQQYHISVVDSY